MDRTAIVARITKLLALANSPNQHEAEAAARKASALMEEYQVGISEVNVKTQFGKTQIIEESYTVAGQKMKLHWVESLALGCAKAFDGTILVNTGLHGTSFRWVGFPEDVGAAKALFEHLYASWFHIVEADLKAAKAEYCVPWQPRDTMKFKQGHGVGYAAALYGRCVQLASDRKNNVRHTSTGTTLVLVKDTALKDYGTEKGWKSSKQSQSTGSNMGRQAGHVAGSSVHIGQNLGSASLKIGRA